MGFTFALDVKVIYRDGRVDDDLYEYRWTFQWAYSCQVPTYIRINLLTHKSSFQTTVMDKYPSTSHGTYSAPFQFNSEPS